MNLPGGGHGRPAQTSQGEGKGGRGGRGRRSRAGRAAGRGLAPLLSPPSSRPRGSRWRSGRASSGAEARRRGTPRHDPTCSFRVLFLRHLGAEPVAREMPITNPAGRASGKPQDAWRPSRSPQPQPRPAFFGPRGVIYS